MSYLPFFLAYLLGSIPFSFLLGKLVHGVDIRQHGSFNVGATNLLRVCGVKSGVAGLVLDAAKGALALHLGGTMLGDGTASWPGGQDTALLLLGLCAMVGHMHGLFLLFTSGGKGVATAAGVFLYLRPGATGVCLAVFLAVVACTRYVSLGSILAALTLPVALVLLGDPFAGPLFTLSIPMALLIVLKHRANMGRLLAGTESRLGGGCDGPTAGAEVDSPDGSET